MSYSAEISRSNPTLLLLLLDQSASMSDLVGNTEGSRQKQQELADAVNRLLQNLAIKCAKEDGVRDYFHISVIGYTNTQTEKRIGPALAGELGTRNVVPLSEIADNPARLEDRNKKVPDGAGGLVEQSVKIPIWLDPVALGGTPMSEAFEYAGEIVSQWLTDHPSCFPPMVLHVTDGESTDGDPTAAAERLKTLESTDGPVLVFNLHLSSTTAEPVMYPDPSVPLPDDHARRLFNVSTMLPEHIRTYAAQEGLSVTEGSRGFVFNADVTGLIQFFDIGTRVSSELR